MNSVIVRPEHLRRLSGVHYARPEGSLYAIRRFSIGDVSGDIWRGQRIPTLEPRRLAACGRGRREVPRGRDPCSVPDRARIPIGGIRRSENHLDVLAPLVSEHGEARVYTTFHLMTVESGRTQKNVVELRIDDQPIGQLTPATSSHYAPTIEHLALADQLVAAKTLLKGNPIQVEAVLHAARSHELDAAWLAPGGSQQDSPPPPAVARPVHIPPKPTAIVFQAPPGWPPPPEVGTDGRMAP